MTYRRRRERGATCRALLWAILAIATIGPVLFATAVLLSR
jgi:hypothetical protein